MTVNLETFRRMKEDVSFVSVSFSFFLTIIGQLKSPLQCRVSVAAATSKLSLGHL
jgi:hypothetical protein